MQRGKKTLIFEVIPVILIHSTNYNEASNITDLSPEHVEWVKKHTNKNPGLIDDIRLAKQFCKANNIYGAESYINGFSGHILDILVIHYGSFINVLKAFSKFKEVSVDHPLVIDTEKHHINPLKVLNQSKISPLIIIDPIQKDRNSAAALSKDQMIIFIDAAKNFLDKPKKDFFEIKKFEMKKNIELAKKKIKNKKFDIIKININTLDGSKDVVGTKVLKVYEGIVSHLKLNDFNVLASGWNFIFEKRFAEIYIITDKNITKDVEQEGPPISAKTDYERFIKKHTEMKHKISLRGNRAYVVMPRKYTDPKKFILDISREEFIKMRVKSIRVI